MSKDLMPVSEALKRVLEGTSRLGSEIVGLSSANARTLATPLIARRTQPPFNASAMDGYAVRTEDAVEGAELTLIGEAAAGRLFHGTVGPGETVRIFTGGAVPEGADAILIQEDSTRETGKIRVSRPVKPNQHIRGIGIDFRKGETVLQDGAVLTPRALGLAASAGFPEVTVARKPRVAIIATGDELVPPGTEPAPGQIVASNIFMLTAIVNNAGAEAIDYGIAPDRTDAIESVARRASDDRVDILVTIGGASVGDYDLVQDALKNIGMELDFWRIAMRPGRPMMYGRLGHTRIMGLAGNPVSTCAGATLFLVPLIRSLLGRSEIHHKIEHAILGVPLAANDWRADHLRSVLTIRGDGPPIATPIRRQDSSMMRDLAESTCLILRPADDPAKTAGDACHIIRLGESM